LPKCIWPVGCTPENTRFIRTPPKFALSHYNTGISKIQPIRRIHVWYLIVYHSISHVFILYSALFVFHVNYMDKLLE